MKDSKEALENLTYCVNGMESQEKYYKIVKQDLDRLEKLEKVIKILKDKEVNIKLLQNKDFKFYTNMLYLYALSPLTEEEFKLLKEVFKNE